MNPEQIIHILFGIFFIFVGIMIIKDSKFRFDFFGKEMVIKKSEKPLFFWVFLSLDFVIGISFLTNGLT